MPNAWQYDCSRAWWPDRRCDRSHKHQHLEGGRAAEAAFYPLPLIRAILRGIQATSDLAHATRDNQIEQVSFISNLANHQGTVPVEPQADVPHSYVSRTNSGKVRVDYHDSNFKLRYLDEHFDEVLDQVLIRAAIVEELNYFNGRTIWQLGDLHKVKQMADIVFAPVGFCATRVMRTTLTCVRAWSHARLIRPVKKMHFGHRHLPVSRRRSYSRCTRAEGIQPLPMARRRSDSLSLILRRLISMAYRLAASTCRCLRNLVCQSISLLNRPNVFTGLGMQE